MMGDAELDEGNVWEALLEEAVRELDNLLWIVDFNRQSLDRIVPDARRGQLREWFARRGLARHRAALGIAAPRALRPAGRRAAARAARGAWRNAEYQSLLRLPPAARAQGADRDARRRRRTRRSTGCSAISRTRRSARSSADVGGHDLASILEAYEEAGRKRSGPCVILADTIKGWGYAVRAAIP